MTGQVCYLTFEFVWFRYYSCIIMMFKTIPLGLVSTTHLNENQTFLLIL
jgi:hypothetical protein